MKAIISYLLIVVVLTACAANEETKPAQRLGAATSETPGFSAVTFDHPMSPLGDMVRNFGEQVGGGLALMSGIEERAATEMAFRNMPYQEAVARFAGAVDCAYIYTPWYYLILPEGYEILQETRVADTLDAHYHDLSASVSLGAKTPLYNVFFALSKSFDVTLVPDNYIAEALCGELFLEDVSLGVIVEAVLQSARITPESFAVESTPEYIFIRSVHNTAPPSLVLNEDALDTDNRAVLARTVSLTLPGVGADPFAATPITVRDALLPLTEQLGVEIVAHRNLADIPVNPCTMQEVRLDTALNLLMRQWPVPGFGYEVQETRILLREQ